jgi:hypothetical protein
MPLFVSRLVIIHFFAAERAARIADEVGSRRGVARFRFE